MASPLDHNPKYLNYCGKDPHDRVFGAIPDAHSSKFSGFSVCYPKHDDQTMDRALRHAISQKTLKQPPSCFSHVGEEE